LVGRVHGRHFGGWWFRKQDWRMVGGMASPVLWSGHEASVASLNLSWFSMSTRTRTWHARASEAGHLSHGCVSRGSACPRGRGHGTQEQQEQTARCTGASVVVQHVHADEDTARKSQKQATRRRGTVVTGGRAACHRRPGDRGRSKHVVRLRNLPNEPTRRRTPYSRLMYGARRN
jgi:hypothetical protein